MLLSPREPRGGWVRVLFTRRAWRKHGVGTALLSDSFARFWERGEHSIGSGLMRRVTRARSASTSALGCLLSSASWFMRRNSTIVGESRG